MARHYGKKRNSTRTLSLFLTLAALFALAGCMVEPRPMSEQEHLDRFLGDKADLALLQEVPPGPVTIHEAIARTVRFNLDNRLAEMESAFSLDQLDAAKLQMLPKLALNAGYRIRDNENASTSISYENRKPSLEPSFSTEKSRYDADISFSWSLLDFGLSYFQAKQQANRYLILMERRRSVLNNLVKEVITSYYRLASLESIRPQVDEAIAEAEAALAAYRQVEERRSQQVAEALEHQRSLISVLQQLKQLSTELALARSRLGALMNIPGGRDFQLAADATEFVPPRLAMSLEQLEDIGVFLRPDLRGESYQERIDKDEVKKELLRMLPGISAFGGGYYDSNRYLVHNFWAEAGGRVTMDILGLAARYKQYKASKTQTEVAKARRLAGTVAAMVQIDMSYYQYQQAISLFDDSRELSRIDGRLLEISSAAAKTRSIGRLENIMRNVTSVNSKLAMDHRMIDVLNAWANLYFSIGCDIMDNSHGLDDLGILTTLAESGLRRWLSGDLPPLPQLGGQCLTGTAYAAMPPPAVYEPETAVPPRAEPVPAPTPQAPRAVATATRRPAEVLSSMTPMAREFR